MSITFNQFLSRIDEAFPTWGSNRGIDKPTGQLSRRSSTRGRTGPQLDWRAPETKSKQTKTPKPSGGITFDDRKTVPVARPPKVELGLKKLGRGTPEPVLTYNRSARKRGYKNPISLNTGKELTGAARRSRVKNLRKQNRLEEFLNLYRQSITES
jgi:hypothetical protein